MIPKRSLCALASLGLLATLTVIADVRSAGQNKPTDWGSYESRETKRGPQLILTFDDGKSDSLSAAADSTVIAYLSDRAWGQLPFLAIDLADTNRVLLRFDLPATKKVRKAELFLRLSGTDHPSPSESFEVSFFSIEEAWSGCASIRCCQTHRPPVPYWPRPPNSLLCRGTLYSCSISRSTERIVRRLVV
jgi:hypothetical protein